MSDRVLPELLDAIEQRELALLGWGITDGSFSEDELLGLIRSIQPEMDANDLLDDLLDRGMVVELLQSARFRSRTAETVRLALELRQWFRGKEWQTAKSLVSDVRFLSRARSVPRRSIEPDELVASLEVASGVDFTPELEAAVRSILAGRNVSGFQQRSATRILDQATGAGLRATCIAAGTGAGKTLAFYLPALAHVLATPRHGKGPRIVALYPRIELLRDQLRSLLTTIRSLGMAGDHVRVGVLYGAVPNDRTDATHHQHRSWRRVADGLLCPILTCLADGCDGSYVWSDEAGKEQVLTCDSCGDVLRSLVFCRELLYRDPPTILFTTTEMVNNLLGARRARRLLIGEVNRGPEFLLLDEVHTYAGTHGAQVANLLRRWRAEMGTRPHLVGLSATLADPSGFLSQVTGVPTSSVVVVEPQSDELTAFGREYFLALRGDPASQTALLSTTIQASMLIRRMLDRAPGIPSEGAYGTRLFVFSDKLDGVNRLHEQLRDAEGWQGAGPNRNPAGSLAVLRGRGGGDERARDRAGQLWAASEDLGTLALHVDVGRTTSRDAGVESGSDIVVATASLEVGFDDPQVGAVLQHKAPRDASQFLQRRGRAGRNPAMRPWTVVVLSDYGRDRLAFQSYEQLFDPVVMPAHLPLRNRVVLKMQATWWLVDHLGSHTGLLHGRTVLQGKGEKQSGKNVNAEKLLVALEAMLTEPGLRRLSSQLRRALDLNDEEVRSILWDHPRALVTAVIPALIRRAQAIIDRNDLPSGYSWSDPLDDFVPRTLFAALQTPEVQVHLPFAGATSAPELESISSAMREFAPGRVSYRYALRGRRQRLWVQPPPASDNEFALETFCSDHLIIEPPPGGTATVYVQPRTMHLTVPPSNVPDAAFGSWRWQTAFQYTGSPLALDLPLGSGWTPFVRSMEALTHRGRCPATIWRFATECEIEPRSSSSPPYVRHQVTLDGAPAAIGFAMDVDALRLTINLPGDLVLLEAPGVLAATRVARFEHQVDTSAVVASHAPSPFLRAWLSQLMTSAVVRDAGAGSIAQVLSAPTLALKAQLIRIAEDLFDVDPHEVAEGMGSVDSGPALLTQLVDLVSHDDVVEELRELGRALHAEPDLTWLPWLQERLATTVGAGLIEAAGAVCPDLDIDELRPDIEIERNAEGAVAHIWLSEDAPGGTGMVEAVIDRYLSDPRAFWSLASRAVGPCDAERVDRTLRKFLDDRRGGGFDVEVRGVRSAEHLSELTDAWAALRTEMFRQGLESDQSVTTALSTRVLRVGSDDRNEDLLRDLLHRWDELESHLGMEVDLQTFATVAATDANYQIRIQDLVGALASTPAARIGQVLGLLWSRGANARSAFLQAYNPYWVQLPTERLLVEALIDQPIALVPYSGLGWREALDAALHRDGRVRLRCESDADASSAIREILIKPTIFGVLEFYPHVVGLTRGRNDIELQVEIREARQ